MSEAYTVPQYAGQPPSGYQDGRPYYFYTTTISSEYSYRTAPSYPSSSSGSYCSAQEPYPPPGGGRSDPRYTNQDYGSYPPRSLPREQSKRYIKGYEKNPYGDFPDDASNASEPRYDDQGYDRKDKFPPGSAMDVQYNTYKAVDNTAGVSNSAYRNARNKLAAPKQSSWDGQAYGVSAGKFHYPEDHETLYAMASTAANDARIHGDIRTKFNQDHIGRVSQRHYTTHNGAAKNAYQSEDNNLARVTYHDARRSKERYP